MFSSLGLVIPSKKKTQRNNEQIEVTGTDIHYYGSAHVDCQVDIFLLCLKNSRKKNTREDTISRTNDDHVKLKQNKRKLTFPFIISIEPS
jgi:hypothetical protein